MHMLEQTEDSETENQDLSPDSTVYHLITIHLSTWSLMFHTVNGNWRFKSTES